MHTWKKVAVAAAVVVASAGGGAAIARQGNEPGALPASETPTRAVKDIGNGTTESKYVAVTPCRIVDTRLAGGKVASNTSRSFDVRGTTGFSDQGGKSTGCGIPSSATAVEVAVTTVEPDDDGYMRIYPYNQSEPTATFINYSPFNPTNTGAVTLCTSSCGAADVTVKGHGSATHVVMDVQGYYSKPIVAHINTDGSTEVSSRLVGVSHTADGVYRLIFDRSLTGCAPVATSWFSGFRIAAQRENSTTILVTQTWDITGNLTDGGFTVEVLC